MALGCDPKTKAIFLPLSLAGQKKSNSRDGQHMHLLHKVAVWFFPSFPSAIVFPGRQSQLSCRSPVFVLSS